MIRKFNKQWRNDEQPRANRSGAGRPPRSEKPRLNRQTVDHAWEHGARPNHPDYRTRSSSQGSSSRNNRRAGSPSDRHPARRNDDRYPARREDRYQSRHRSDERENSRNSYGDNERYSRDDNARSTRRSYERREPREQASYGRTSRRPEPDQSNYRSARGRSDTRRRGNEAGYRGPDKSNPRWQSRPQNQRRRPYRQDEPQDEYFEGDYERFTDYEDRAPVPDRHVTRLPNGRVLKGTRKEQREKAAFWNEVEQESETMLPHLPEPYHASREDKKTQPAKPSKKAGNRAESKAPREKKTRSKKQPPPPVTRPSQRGYKWPTREE